MAPQDNAQSPQMAVSEETAIQIIGMHKQGFLAFQVGQHCVPSRHGHKVLIGIVPRPLVRAGIFEKVGQLGNLAFPRLVLIRRRFPALGILEPGLGIAK